MFFRIESFPAMKEFNFSRSFKAYFLLEVSKANRQLQQTSVRCWYEKLACGVEQTGVEEFSTAFFCLMILNEPCP